MKKVFEGGSGVEKSLVVATDLLLLNSEIKLNMKCNYWGSLTSECCHYKCEMCAWWHWTQTGTRSWNLCIFYPLATWVNWCLWHSPNYLLYNEMFCSSDCIEEELLKTVMLHGKARGEDTFQNFYSRLLEMNVPVHILCTLPQMACFPRLI